MGDACPNCGVWLGNEPLPNDSAWARQQAEIERLRAAGDAMAEALDALCDSYCGNEADADLVDAWREVRRG